MISPRSATVLIIKSILIFTCFEIGAQGHERDHWYFGVNAGLKFTNGSPTVVTGGQTSQVNATATVSDASGNLLFYTDGGRIWNRQHQIMTNGGDLDGYDGNYAQQVVIVQHPGDINRYYVFYVSDRNFPVHLHRLKYSVVNMGVGDGVVESKDITLPTDDIMVKITALEKRGEAFWIITQGDQTGKYFAFRGTGAGIETSPVVTAIGVAPQNSFDYGELRFSPDGKVLAATNAFSQRISLFKFDFTTGILSQPLLLTADKPASIEFASEGSLMYVTSLSNCSVNTLYQYDISAYTQTAIVNSRLAIGSSSNIGMLQRGPDNIIYTGKRSSQCNLNAYIGTIGSPNVRGMGATFTAESINLQGGTVFQGLPNFSTVSTIVTCYDATTLPADVTLCNEPSYTIDLSNSTAKLLWENGSTHPVRTFTQSGVYTVESTKGSCKETDTIRILFNNNTTSFGADTVHTFYFPITLAPSINESGIKLVWQDNSHNNVYQAFAPGEYTFTADKDGCIRHDTLVVRQREIFIPNIITVNGDGKNDFFELPFILPGEHWVVTIYNRYGIEIFSDPSYQNTWQSSHSQVCYYRITNQEHGIDVKGVLHVL